MCACFLSIFTVCLFIKCHHEQKRRLRMASGVTAPGPAPSQQLFIACLILTYCYLCLANVTSYDQDVDVQSALEIKQIIVFNSHLHVI